jgi:hypothetical protein
MAGDPGEIRARLETLGDGLAEVRRRVELIEAQLAAQGTTTTSLPRMAVATAGGGEPAHSIAPEGFAEAIPLAGRALLAVGGAYLLRALADAGVTPGGGTATLGLLYAGGWFVAGERSARQRRRLEAVAYDLVALVIAYPLILEATLRLRLLSAGAAACWLVAFFCLGLWVAGRQGLPGIAWLNAIAAVAVSLVLQAGTRALLPFAFALLVLTAILEGFAFADRWLALRWLAALASNSAVAISVFIATRPEGLPRGYAPAPPAAVAALSLSLAFLFVLSVVLRTLLRGRRSTGFETVQLPLALLLGLWGAGRALSAAGQGWVAVAWASLWLGAGFCVAAFFVIERHRSPARNFYLYSTLGAALLLAGTGALLPGPALAPTWCALATAAALVGSRFGRLTLRAHALLYATFAAAAGGLLASASGALLAPPGSWPPPGWGALLAFVTLLVCYLAPIDLGPAGAETRASRLAAGLTAGAGAWAGLGLAVDTLARAAQTTAGADAARLAALRTVVVAVAAVATAWASRRFERRELAWLAWLALIAVGLKLVAEDLRVGRPATLFPALAAYGAALIVAPRLLRNGTGVPDRESNT